MFCVYLFKDPKSLIWRYVGKGKLTRPTAHVKYGSHNPELHAMLQKRMREGFDVAPEIIQVPSEDHAGGEGCSGRIATTEERLAASLRYQA